MCGFIGPLTALIMINISHDISLHFSSPRIFLLGSVIAKVCKWVGVKTPREELKDKDLGHFLMLTQSNAEIFLTEIRKRFC